MRGNVKVITFLRNIIEQKDQTPILPNHLDDLQIKIKPRYSTYNSCCEDYSFRNNINSKYNNDISE